DREHDDRDGDHGQFLRVHGAQSTERVAPWFVPRNAGLAWAMSDFDAPTTYRGLRVHLEGDEARRAVEDLAWETLPDADVTVRVAYSSLNYKDALSASGNRGVSRNYPHTPGIDAA